VAGSGAASSGGGAQKAVKYVFEIKETDFQQMFNSTNFSDF
jgi:hypothetical protein